MTHDHDTAIDLMPMILSCVAIHKKLAEDYPEGIANDYTYTYLVNTLRDKSDVLAGLGVNYGDYLEGDHHNLRELGSELG